MATNYLADDEQDQDYVTSNDSGPTSGANIDLGDVAPGTVFGSPLTPGPTPAERARARAADIATQRPVRPGSMVPGPGQVGDEAPSGDTVAGTGQVKAPGGPGFWRNLASIGVGLAGGYTNSANPRGPQVDVGQAMDNIKFGGYNRKVDDWAKREKDANTQAEQLSRSEAEQKANQDSASRITLQNAEANHANAAADSLRNPKGPRPVAEPKNEYEQRNEMADKLGLDRKDPKTLAWIQYGKEAPSAKDPKALTSSDYLVGKDGFYYIDPKDPTNPKKVQGGAAPTAKAEYDPMAAVVANNTAKDARQDQEDARKNAVARNSAKSRRTSEELAAETDFAQRKAALDKEIQPGIDPVTKKEKKQSDIAAAQTAYGAKLTALEDELQKRKQLANDAEETVYAGQGIAVNHNVVPHPSTQRRSGAAPTPSGPSSVNPVGAPPSAAPTAPPQAPSLPVGAGPGTQPDPRVTAYANQFYHGDVKAALAAIAAQRAGKK